ncbi:FCD domain-containing protein [Pseudoroseomonas wenyumeiae]|uniref:FCD domain-containing protein n=1 Tax=Teichococcus wenyumeiae TaxID=2478470 RepID=A0A3A9JAA8_9PROT|nr:GntR family transcriptional regulator [Pseudoroseomonas wenyumeiae]RKK02990.1 GntR family transcriptional regulator [Pseudoroseomonas wenyumeiae]RMI15512.1 FCD domain-containing protein [Pseudoroseomonas wenyumeiae]
MSLTTSLPVLARTSLNDRVYETLRAALLEGRLRPHQRLKIRDLASTMGVSETPVREAVMQLVRERALTLQTSRSLTVPRLSTSQYLELRQIRLELEGLAAAHAAERISARDITALAKLHERLLKAEETGQAAEAVRSNWHFHARLYEAAAMPELFHLIQGLWLRNGPLLTYLYPHAAPTYPGRHRHLDVLDALRARDGARVRAAVQADMIEGGAGLLRLLQDLDASRLSEAPFAVGSNPDPLQAVA